MQYNIFNTIKENILRLAVCFWWSHVSLKQNGKNKTEYASSQIALLFHTWKLLNMKLKDRHHFCLQIKLKRIDSIFPRTREAKHRILISI